MDEIIDAHHHLWQYNPKEYGWIDESMGILRRDFLPEDLAVELKAASVRGAVVIQARQTLAETAWLLDLADQSPSILGVVGWAPIADPTFTECLEELLKRPKLKGLRHVVQDEASDDFLLDKNFNRGMAALQGTDLSYDLLVRSSQLSATVEFVQRFPKQRFILDHMAKPDIRGNNNADWRRDFIRLGAFPNVTCKVSGLATEANWNSWSLDDLLPYLELALEVFGPDRLMAASDWPVCLLASSYTRWWSVLGIWANRFTASDRQMFFAGTAIEQYRLLAGLTP